MTEESLLTFPPLEISRTAKAVITRI